MDVKGVRYLLVILLISLPLIGCEDMGFRESDPAELVNRYTDENSRFIEVNGVRVHAHAEGEGQAILLLHGAMDSLHVWDAWAERLKDAYQVIRVDIPPFGLSGQMPDDDYGPGNITAVFNHVLDSYGIESVTVVGHSLGGFYAGYFAAHAPERVEALALISAAAYPQSLPWTLRLANLPIIGMLYEIATPRPLVRLSMRSMYGKPEQVVERAVQRRYDLLRAPGNRPAARDVTRMMAEKADEEPVWARRITQPALLIWGGEDEWVPLDIAHRWLNDLQNARLVVYPDVGHVPMEEIPEDTAAEFRRFLSRETD